MNKQMNKQMGITLIALIVTIIVLIILAGISITLILGENGIIKKAELAKQAQEDAQIKENEDMDKLLGEINKELGTNRKTEEELKAILSQQLGDSAIDEEGNIVDILLWQYRITSETNYTCEIYGVRGEYETVIAYRGDIEKEQLEEGIPAYIKVGDTIYKMTSIGEYSLWNCSNLTSITIPNTVTSIGSSAFSDCSNLTNIEIPNSVTSIGSSAFSDCSNLTNIEIPNSVTSIGSSAFSGCSSLTSIEIPNSVTSIEYNVFSGCSNLTDITIPEGVWRIGNYAFRNCSSLTSIDIPKNVANVGCGVFSGCTNLESIKIDKNNSNFNTSDCNAIITITTGELMAGCKNTVITETLGIVSNAFENCTGLTSIIIPYPVSWIGSESFSGCSNLTSIVISNSVKQINSDAFNGCTSLTKVYYEGSEDEWKQISIDSTNSYLINASKEYNYSE